MFSIHRFISPSTSLFRLRIHTLLFILLFIAIGAHAHAATHTLGQGANLQQALDAAQPGDTIVLEAGASFVGPFTLPNKQGDGWITIQSSALAQLAEGRRATPADSSLMPKILAPNPGGGT